MRMCVGGMPLGGMRQNQEGLLAVWMTAVSQRGRSCCCVLATVKQPVPGRNWQAAQQSTNRSRMGPEYTEMN